MRLLSLMPIGLLLGSSPGALAAQTLPIVAGRYSSESCDKASAISTRVFRPGATSTFNEDCTIRITATDGRVYNAHLACRYKQADPAEDDVVLRVDSPLSVTWIDQCTAMSYHRCGP